MMPRPGRNSRFGIQRRCRGNGTLQQDPCFWNSRKKREI
jgi:hypothetical protein